MPLAVYILTAHYRARSHAGQKTNSNESEVAGSRSAGGLEIMSSRTPAGQRNVAKDAGTLLPHARLLQSTSQEAKSERCRNMFLDCTRCSLEDDHPLYERTAGCLTSARE